MSFRDDISLNKNNLDLITKHGLDYGYALNYFLKSFSFVDSDKNITKLNLPFRSFIIAIANRISNGESELHDDLIASDLDCIKGTVCRLRKRLKDLQYSCSQSLIQISEGKKYQDSFGRWRYEKTKYKISFLDLIAIAVANAQNAIDYHYNRVNAIEREIDKVIKKTPAENGWKKRNPAKKRPISAERITARKQVKNWGYRCLSLAQKDDDDTFRENELLIDLLEQNFEQVIVQSDDNYYFKTFREVEKLKVIERKNL